MKNDDKWIDELKEGQTKTKVISAIGAYNRNKHTQTFSFIYFNSDSLYCSKLLLQKPQKNEIS